MAEAPSSDTRWAEGIARLEQDQFSLDPEVRKRAKEAIVADAKALHAHEKALEAEYVASLKEPETTYAWATPDPHAAVLKAGLEKASLTPPGAPSIIKEAALEFGAAAPAVKIMEAAAPYVEPVVRAAAPWVAPVTGPIVEGAKKYGGRALEAAKKALMGTPGKGKAVRTREPRKLVETSTDELLEAWHRYRNDYAKKPSEALDLRIETLGEELAWRTGLAEGTPFGTRGFRPVVHKTGKADTLPAKEVAEEVAEEAAEHLADLRGAPPPLNEDGTITLYHRTTPENAAKIRRTGKFVSQENTDEIYFSNQLEEQAQGYGTEVVEVRVDPNDVYLDDAFDGEIHVRVKRSDAERALPAQAPQAATRAPFHDESVTARATEKIRESLKPGGEAVEEAAQETAVRHTPAFKKRFEGSKVVDEKGEPLVVYHGTPGGRFSDQARRRNEGLEERATLIKERSVASDELHRLGAERRASKEAVTELFPAAKKAWQDFPWPKSRMVPVAEPPGSRKLVRGKPSIDELVNPIGVANIEEAGPLQFWVDAHKKAQRTDARRVEIEGHIKALEERLGELPRGKKTKPEEVFRTTSGGTTDWGYRSSGAYFTPDLKEAQGYARALGSKEGHVYKVHLDLKNPFIEGVTEVPAGMMEDINRLTEKAKRDAGGAWKWLDTIEEDRASIRRQVLEKYGFDGEIWHTKGKGIEYIAFEPEQIIPAQAPLE